jgi:putative FmdB family regulatory protein
MPIYEYQCTDCQKKINVLVLKSEDQRQLVCPQCKGKNLVRLFSRFASPKSEEARMESLADPSKWSGLDENDPKSMVKLLKKMGKELGEEMGEDYDKIIEEAEEEASKSGQAGKSGDDLYTPGELSGD